MRSIEIHMPAGQKYTWIDALFVFLIAVSPLLQHYKGLFINGGVTVMILALPYVFVKLVIKNVIPFRTFRVIAPFLPFLLFKVVDHGTYVAEFGQVMILILFAFAFGSGTVSTNLFIRIVLGISCAASVLIVLQYICYYILGFHLRLVPISLFLDSSAQWVELAKTGRVGVTGRVISFYRPSAFFLEPSHMFLYLCAPLLYEVLNPRFGKREKRRAVLLSVGIVLSTSGMGIGVTLGAWLLHLAKKGGRDRRLTLSKLLKPKKLVILGGLAVVLVVLFYRVNFFHQSVMRVFSSDSGHGSAISGRVTLGSAFIRGMRGKQLLFGISDQYSEIDFNMSGFYGTMYKYGIVGTALSYLFYLKCMIDLKEQYFWIAAVVVVVSFFSAHTHGTFYMLYFTIILLDGYVRKEAARNVPREVAQLQKILEG